MTLYLDVSILFMIARDTLYATSLVQPDTRLSLLYSSERGSGKDVAYLVFGLVPKVFRVQARACSWKVSGTRIFVTLSFWVYINQSNKIPNFV